MKKHIYAVEVGVLIPTSEPEYEYCHSLEEFPNYSHFSFWDTNYLIFTNKKQAIQYAKEYLSKESERGYAYLVDRGEHDITQEEYAQIFNWACSDSFEWKHPQSEKHILMFLYHNEKGELKDYVEELAMKENKTKAIAQKFIDNQQQIGDYIALEELMKDLIKNPNTELEPYRKFVSEMLKANDRITGMEMGTISYDLFYDGVYREGILLLLDKCESIINK